MLVYLNFIDAVNNKLYTYVDLVKQRDKDVITVDGTEP